MTAGDIGVRAAAPGDADAVLAIWLACLREGAWEGIDETDLRRQAEEVGVEEAGAERVGTLVAIVGGAVVGSATPAVNDLSVAAAFRRRGVGTALARASLDMVRAAGDPSLLLYVPGGGDPPRDTAARGFAEARGFAYRATLTRMRLDGLASAPEPVLPPGLVLRSLDTARGGPARDDTARYVALVNAAFADHPTPLSLDVATITRAHAAAGFDHAGIALVVAADDPDRILAFVRTVVRHDDAGATFGEVRLVGVEPASRGRGLGRALLRWSIARFRHLGLDRAELSVVAANDAALSLYRSEGFRTTVAWPQWSLDAGTG